MPFLTLLGAFLNGFVSFASQMDTICKTSPYIAIEPLAILKQCCCETKTDLKALKAVLAWFDGFHDLPVPQDIWLQCQLALIEGFTNVVRHAHKGLPEDTPIVIEAIATTEYLDIKVWDKGPGFDFEAMLEYKQKNTTVDSTGGRGLRIMDRVADIVEYCQVADHNNYLHIRKGFENAA